MIVLAWLSGRLELVGRVKLDIQRLIIVSSNSSQGWDLVLMVRMNMEKSIFSSEGPLWRLVCERRVALPQHLEFRERPVATSACCSLVETRYSEEKG